MLLTDLPPEIHGQIASHLELPALLKLAATSYYFKKVINRQLIREKLQAYERTNTRTVMTLGKRPCYGCLRMRNDDDFYTATGWDPPFEVSVLWNGICVRFGADEAYLERRCFECDDHASFRLGRNLRPGVINGLTWPIPIVPACNGSSSTNSTATSDLDTDGTSDGLNGLAISAD
jgi:hypothetical protein